MLKKPDLVVPKYPLDKVDQNETQLRFMLRHLIAFKLYTKVPWHTYLRSWQIRRYVRGNEV